jgi:hypothetical protein
MKYTINLNFFQVRYYTQKLGDPEFRWKLEDIYNATKLEQSDIYYTFYWLNAGN